MNRWVEIKKNNESKRIKKINKIILNKNWIQNFRLRYALSS